MKERAENKNHTVASAAAVNVDSYLRGVARQVRVPSASGGRGNRRRLASQTEEPTVGAAPQQMTHVKEVDVDDEWDEVVLPNATVVPISKNESMVKNEDKMVAEGPETDTAGRVLPQHAIKAEAIDINTAGGNIHPILENSAQGNEQSSPNGRWRRHDPAFQEMIEQQQALAARRRFELLQRTKREISTLYLALFRGRGIIQEARRPHLVRALLRLHVSNEGGPRTYPLLSAVCRARELSEKALDSSHKIPTLAPCWVTANKDGVGNYSSASILCLVNAINSLFTLDSTIRPEVLSNWAAPIKPGYLFEQLSTRRSSMEAQTSKIILPHTLYLCAIFLSLATVSKISCRLVMALQKQREEHSATQNDTGSAQEELTLFGPKKRSRDDVSGRKESATKRPTSAFWLEVWCPQRESFISVNPCEECSTLWGVPYVFSIDGDIVMDVTPRYSTKYSSVATRRLGQCGKYRQIWKDIPWDERREASEVIVDSFRTDLTRCARVKLEREREQLHALMYVEEVPKTLSLLQRHPLFILENGLTRYEGIYPKDASTMVGVVKGHVVYKRSAVVSLRSRDGWLREGRSVPSGEEAYKVIPPPPSRPFAKSISLFGAWQTRVFEPEPLGNDGLIPKHPNTNWYILLDKPAPPGLVLMCQPNIVRVARRMDIDFGIAVTGFRRRKAIEVRSSRWEAVVGGIIVKEVNASSLLKAYEEWRQLVEEQELAKRKHRAFKWWLHLARRVLAFERIRQQYFEGASHGHFPVH
uniref:Uncharacterized protein TCIL3000_9_4920 n=1 Tax=Trypanosoma congolense (strain IL3000) TaxID=1068625 RepID=G0UUM4_TRYCI|nr:unnamed protein product [Trypanosoma congolense IL3000]